MSNIERPKTLSVPKGDGTSSPDDLTSFVALEDIESLVIVGANGSGKSRFGWAIERANQTDLQVQRIAAQRALEIPQSIQPSDTEKAENEYYFGRADRTNASQRLQFRWRQKPVTGLLSDYVKLMQLIFAKTNERDFALAQSYRDGNPLSVLPESPADKIERVWNTLMPHRQLEFEASKILAFSEEESYNASEMSDGERVILYLMGSVFVASEGSVLIIDEPEIHLHRSIRDSLFDALEAERSDCLFVYLTHDIEFAMSRPVATHMWLKEFTGKGWLWEPLAKEEGLPATLVAELLGSRRPVLFVEGESDSLDTLIYKAAYPGRYVVPVGSCTKVIHFTKAINESPQLHHLSAKGIIDRDRRTDDVVTSLLSDQIHVLPVAEVENLLLTQPVLSSIAGLLDYSQEVVENAKSTVLQRLLNERTSQINQHVKYRVQRRSVSAINGAEESIGALEAVLRGCLVTMRDGATSSGSR